MSFVREYTVKATRKPARCAGCETPIPVGSEAVRWAGMTEGEFSTAAYHPDCRQAEIAFNRQAGGDCYDWYSLKYDRDPDDTLWLIPDFPQVAERLGLTKESAQ